MNNEFEAIFEVNQTPNIDIDFTVQPIRYDVDFSMDFTPTALSQLINDVGFITLDSVGNGKLTILQNGEEKGTFYANQFGNTIVDLTGGEQYVYFADIQGDAYDNTSLAYALNSKQTTLISGTNIKTINNESLLGSGNIDITSAEWGNITGTLSSQIDLQTALNGKYDSSNPEGYISGINSSMVVNALGYTPYNAANPNNYISRNGISGTSPIAYNSSTGKISVATGYQIPTTTQVAKITSNETAIGNIQTTLNGYGDIVTHDVSEFATSVQGTKADSALQPSDVVNNVTSTVTNKPLSANMGKELSDRITNLESLGRYLSEWDCTTGLALTNPPYSPYEYKTGDYFLIQKVAPPSGDNYKPHGTTYTIDVPSTEIELMTVAIGDMYLFDGTMWILRNIVTKEVLFSNIGGQPYDNTELATALNQKQFTIYDLTNIRSNATNGQSAYTTISGYGDIVTHNASEFMLSNVKYGAGIDYDSTNSTLTLSDQDGNELDTTTIEIPQSAEWGNITGTLSNQTDLQGALNSKYDASNPSGFQTATQVNNAITSATSSFITKDVNNLTNYTTTTNLNTALALKQNITDNTLTTTNKTIVGAINEVNAKEIITLLSGLSDVIITSPTQGQNLTYDAINGKWINTSTTATVAWGGITGTITDQTDLKNALDGKQAIISDLATIRSNAESAIQGVQVAGTDLTIDENKKVNIPNATGSVKGVVQGNNSNGINFNQGVAYLVNPTEAEIIAKSSSTRKAIMPQFLDIAIREGLGNNSLTWTDEYKESARETIGAASSVQGALANTALQPNDDISELNNDVGYITSSYHDATKQDTISDLTTIRNDATNGQSAYTTISGYGNIVTHNVSEFATASQGAKADSAVQNLSDLGITATASELNVLDGITATTTELNYTDGVTSNIQTQLNNKQATISDLTTIRSNATNGQSAYTTISGYGNIVTHNTSEFATSAQGAKADSALQQTDIVNNTTSTATNKVLSANAGKSLQDQLNNLLGRGKYLSIWDCTTGLAMDEPPVNPYTVETGSYFIVGKVGTTNYRPNGGTYDKDVPSTTIETGTVKVNDTYYYDGTVWRLLDTPSTSVAFSTIAGSPYDNTNLKNALDAKQATISDLTTIRSNATNGQSAYTTIAGYGNIVTHNVSEFATAAQGAKADTALQPNDNISELNNDAGYITSSYHDATKQDTLVSGTNIKTINSQSILGSGDIEIQSQEYYAGNGLSLNNYAFSIEQVGSDSYNIIPHGNIVNTDGVLTNFSDTNYAEINFSGFGNSVEMVIAFTTQANEPTGLDEFLIGCGVDLYNVVIGYRPGRKLGYWLSTNGTTWNAIDSQPGSNTLNPSTKYYIKLTLENNSYKFYISTDKTNWVIDKSVSVSSNRIHGSTLYLGNCYDFIVDHVWKGSIDLNDSYIKADGVYVWTGVTHAGTVAKATNSLYGLVKPDNSTITVSDGVISISSSYHDNTKQNITDNTLTTTSKTIVGAINELDARPSVTSLSALTDVTLTTPADKDTLIYNSTSQKWENGKSLNGYNVGDIFYTSRLDTSLNGAVECNGGTYSTADYTGDGSIGLLLQAGKLPYVSISQFDSIVASKGSCRAFGWDGGANTTFKVPKLADVYIEAGTASTAGEFIDESLPNITGSFVSTTGAVQGKWYRHYSLNATGAFTADYTYSDVANDSATSSTTAKAGFNFSAHNSSLIYQDNAHVHPNSVRYRAMVQLFNSATDEAVAICGDVVAEVAQNTSDIADRYTKTESDTLLNSKANTSLSNLTDAGNKKMDGQWVYSYYGLMNGITTNANYTYTYDISSYLPNDGYNYEVLIEGSWTCNGTRGPHALQASSDYTAGSYTVWLGRAATASELCAGSGILPVSTSRKVYLKTASQSQTAVWTGIQGYRRLGTNS